MELEWVTINTLIRILRVSFKSTRITYNWLTLNFRLKENLVWTLIKSKPFKKLERIFWNSYLLWSLTVQLINEDNLSVNIRTILPSVSNLIIKRMIRLNNQKLSPSSLTVSLCSRVIWLRSSSKWFQLFSNPFYLWFLMTSILILIIEIISLSWSKLWLKIALECLARFLEICSRLWLTV